MRDAPSLDIVPGLIAKGAKVRAHDPQGMKEARHMLPEAVVYCDGPYEACADADAVVIITEWNIYRALDLQRLKQTLKTPILVDLRNIYEPAEIAKQGFTYVSIGR